MKKKILALTVALVLLFSEAGSVINPSQVQASVGAPAIQILSPDAYSSPFELITPKDTVLEIELYLIKSGGPEKYPQINNPTLTFNPQQYSPTVVNIFYSLDNADNVSLGLPLTGTQFYVSNTQLGISAKVNQTLRNLTEGKHTLKAYSLDTNGEYLTDQITFMVNSSISYPSISIISPQNKTYNTNNIPLTCIVTGEFDSINYGFDFQRVASPLKGNMTFANISEGTHFVKIFGLSTKHYIAGPSKTIFFSINSSETEKNPTLNNQPTISLAIVTVIVVGVGVMVIASLLLYKRFRNNKAKDERFTAS